MKALILTTITVVFGVLSGSVSGEQSVSDESIRRLLVGTWGIAIQGAEYSVYGETQYRKDGSRSGRGIILSNETEERTSFEGTWHVEDGYLISETTSSPNPEYFPYPKTYRDKIEKISAEELVLIHSDGDRSTRHKVSEPLLIPE